MTESRKAMLRAIALVLLPLAVAGDFPPCSVEDPACPDGLACDIVAKRCYHEPRQLGEACGKHPKTRNCAPFYGNTTHALECSAWCGVCVLKDQLDELEAASNEASARAKHAAAVHAVAARCGIQSNTTFVNFEETLITNMPILYPASDSELENFLKIIAKNGCKARPVGATHTSSSVITSEVESTTVGISLAEYTPGDKAWRGVLDSASSSVKVPAGWSLFQLYELVRPEGYFLPTQTAGPIFTMGGILANTVHGGVWKAGMISEYVLSLRVALWTAKGVEFRVITEEAELRHWRNSFGLLGLVTAVEFKLDHRDGFIVSTEHHRFFNFTRGSVERYFDKLLDNYMYTESFFNPYANEVNSVLFKVGGAIPESCHGVTNKLCRWDYLKAKCENPECCHYQYRFGDVDLTESCRAIYTPQKSPEEFQTAYKGLDGAMKNIPYFGAPDLTDAQNSELCILEWAGTVNASERLEEVLSYAFYDRVNIQIDSQVQQNSLDVNDGFYLRSVPHGIKLMAYFIPKDKLFDLLLALKTTFLDIEAETGARILGNAEFRFVNVTDKFTLFPTGAVSKVPKSGLFVNCEVVFNSKPMTNATHWSTALYKYEQQMRAMDGFVHTGKSFCYGRGSDGEIHAYADKSCVKSIFNDKQKATFNAYRNTSDPLSLFDAGAAVEFF